MWFSRRTQIFLSYRRRRPDRPFDGGELAGRLYERLNRRGFRVFMDVESLRSGPFNAAIYREIESARDVLVILSPGSLDQTRKDNPEEDWMRMEVEHAYRCKKNIVPVIMPGFKRPPHELPSAMEHLLREQGLIHNSDLFSENVDKLVNKLLRSTPLPRWVRLLKVVGIPALAVAISLATATWVIYDRGNAPPPPVRQILVTADEIADAHKRLRPDNGPPSLPASTTAPETNVAGANSGPARLTGTNITALDGLADAEKAAKGWDPQATARQIVADRWEKYAANDDQILLKVTAWRYTFAAGVRGIDVIITGGAVRQEPLDAAAAFLTKLDPLETWVLDAQGAFGSVVAAGGNATAQNNFPPTLRMHKVKGTSQPVWIVPISTRGFGSSTLVNARTGLLIDLSDVELPK